MIESNIEIGRAYRFRHRRKGEFVGTVLAVEPTKPGDPDPCFVRVRIDTHGPTMKADGTVEEPGSPYAWMANSFEYVDGRKTTPKMTEKLIRPSLILGMEKV